MRQDELQDKQYAMSVWVVVGQPEIKCSNNILGLVIQEHHSWKNMLVEWGQQSPVVSGKLQFPNESNMKMLHIVTLSVYFVLNAFFALCNKIEKVTVAINCECIRIFNFQRWCLHLSKAVPQSAVRSKAADHWDFETAA